MLQASQADLQEIQEQEQEGLGLINLLALSYIVKVSDRYISSLKGLFAMPDVKRSKVLKGLENNLVNQYSKMFNGVRDGVLLQYNESRLREAFLAEQSARREFKWRKSTWYENIPKGTDFEITNKVLSEKSVLRRNKVLAGRVTGIIKESVDKGRSITKTTAILEQEFGLRDKSGKRNLQKLKTGKFTTTNGHFYQVYRIARTESMRMLSIQSNDVAQELKNKGEDIRLRMVAKLDGRTRPQSRRMNGQLSRADFKLKYPNGFYYAHGKAPARY